MWRALRPSLLLAVLILGCSESEPPSSKAVEVTGLFGEPVLDPTGNTPLAAELPFFPSGDMTVVIRVLDVDSEEETESDASWELQVSGAAEQVRLPILGLFPDHENRVTVSVFDAGGRALGKERVGTGSPRLAWRGHACAARPLRDRPVVRRHCGGRVRSGVRALGRDDGERARRRRFRHEPALRRRLRAAIRRR